MAPKEKKEVVKNDIEDLRDYSVKLIKKCLVHDKTLPADIIEEGIFDSLDQFNMTAYTILLIKVLENLKIPYVKEQLKKGTWKPEDLCTLDKDTLFPEKWQQLQEIRLPKNAKKEKRKGTHKCPRCKSWYTTYSQAQTRSADEGLTTRVECSDCSFVFKFS